MGLILVLGGIGIANGLWSHNLKVDGVVETGDLDADWDCVWTNDDGLQFTNFTAPHPCNQFTLGTSYNETSAALTGEDPCSDPNPNDCDYPHKNVGRCTVTLDANHADLAHVLLENTYPSYECQISLVVSNTGTIPFNVVGAAINVPAPLELLGDEHCGVVEVQVDPAREKLISCTVHVMQAAVQSSGCNNDEFHANPSDPSFIPGFGQTKDFNCTNQQHYNFDLLVCVAQWNEAVNIDTCKIHADNPPAP